MDSGIIFQIEAKLREEFQELRSNLPDKAEDLMKNASDGIGEIYRGAMVAEAPYLWGDLREGHEVEERGPLEIYVFSDVPHFEPVVNGHKITGPFNSAKQLAWWFWYLKNELGGEYEPKYGTGNKTEGDDYPARAMVIADPEVEARLQKFLDEVVEGN